VERREGNELVEFCQHFRSDADRACKVAPAVDDPMPDCHEFVVGRRSGEEIEQVSQRLRVSEGLAPALFAQYGIAAVAGDEMRGTADMLDFPVEPQVKRPGREQRELEARGAGVQDEQRIGQSCSPNEKGQSALPLVASP